MTELLFLSDMDRAYERTFEATVVARPPGALVLDRTLFYPTGGGQPADRGMIEGPGGGRFPVVDVRKSGDTVVHALGRPTPSSAAPIGVDARVTGTIEWERRHRHMRLHTAQHLVSALLFEASGLRTVRAAMAADGATIDLDGPWPAHLPWSAFETVVADALARPREVSIRFVARTEWDAHPSPRSGRVPLADRVDPVRLIEIGEIDRCPCGGTHVRSTGEIGEIDLFAPTAQTGAAGSRVGFRLRGRSAHSERVTP